MSTLEAQEPMVEVEVPHTLEEVAVSAMSAAADVTTAAEEDDFPAGTAGRAAMLGL